MTTLLDPLASRLAQSLSQLKQQYQHHFQQDGLNNSASQQQGAVFVCPRLVDYVVVVGRRYYSI